MTIKITHSTTIGELQKTFSNEYPFLKIEFFDKAHKKGEPVLQGHFYHPDFLVSEIAGRLDIGLITILPWHETGYTEEVFENRFGLHSQIFRRENGKWIQTAGTDVFTLNGKTNSGKACLKRTGTIEWKLSIYYNSQ